VSLAPRPDGKIGSRLEVIVDGAEPLDSALRCSKRERRRLAQTESTEHGRLNYRVIEAL
jgi:hypothetical protein